MPPDAPEASDESKNGAQSSLLEPQEDQNSKVSELDLDRDTDELLTDVTEGGKLRRILRNVYRRSRTDFEERGVRILFLTFGILEWKEIEESRNHTVPDTLGPGRIEAGIS